MLIASYFMVETKEIISYKVIMVVYRKYFR